ncbi:S1 family peptidase [Arcticibacterium luteifluviistationis]|uniref:Serine protease n=1 Tax=Arcticibacterium luteifluviistationis TaxID=1784714 RepID=A0A2Z4G894_9BACT|nr:serine protease [Arcticibacterium luteifluviistationis]AWV97397.1 serine protease [Arcticibacterium luteifluviistationis]
MFINAIETAAGFTRALHTIVRNYGSDKIIPGAATLFFVNDEGYALTCKHVADVLINANKVNQTYKKYKDELAQSPTSRGLQNELQKKFGYHTKSLIDFKTKFINCADNIQNLTIHTHAEHDLAILKFNGFSKLNINTFPVFKKTSEEIKQGKSLCRLGYPFPEFSNFRFNKTKDEIEWTKKGVSQSPQFPIDGMITRFIGDNKGQIGGIELSTPGLRGQSGGPLFDQNGIIYGMQSRTKHLHLGFDLENKPIQVEGEEKLVNNYSFLHLGECVHVGIIKDFLRQHKVRFQEAD